MKQQGDAVYLQHVLDSIEKIERYVEDVDEKTFAQNSLIQDGVIRQLGVVGEAVKRLSSALRARHTGIPWQDFEGMRDKLIHDYMGVDLGAVWYTATEDVPVLKKQIEHILHFMRSAS